MLTRIVPVAAVHTVRGCVTYLQRLFMWMQVIGIAKGRSPRDAAVLRRSILRAPLRAFRKLRTWEEPKLVADAEIRIKGLGTFSIRGESDDLGHVLPYNQSSLFSTIARLVRPGDSVVDAGANIGVVSVFLARQVGPSGKVLAVEMMKETADRLRMNLQLNDITWVSVCESALSSVAGETVKAEMADGLFGQASIAAGANRGRAVRQVEVITTTLDDITADMGSIALIKLDIEGSEPEALAGASKALARTKAVVFESWRGDGGQTAAALASAGFAITAIDTRNFLALNSGRAPR